MTVYTDTIQGKDFFTNYASWDLKEMTWTGEFIELPDVSIETENLITGWTNSGTNPWDILTETDEVIDSAIETTGNIGWAVSNDITRDEGEEFHVTWTLTKNSGDWAGFSFAGDTYALSAASGSTTMTATSSGTGAFVFTLADTKTANYADVTICLYRKYGH